ncbi:MAG: glycosyltransferase family 4 protein, partial [Actinobacteria bacterium]|nr:glycosyltransferase family 4 protein [Actinomycetota bacterium]
VSIEGVDIREIAAGGATTGLGRLGFARRIARDVARERFDVLHLLFPFTTDDGYTLADGAPLVCGPINVAWPSSRRAGSLPARAAGAVTDVLEGRRHAQTLQRAARLLVVGQSARTRIAPSLRDKIVDIPFGVDVERFTPSSLPEEPVVLFSSVLQQRKGVEVLVRALHLLTQRIPRARVVIAGPDPEGMRPSLERLAGELCVAGRLEFVGPIDPRDTPALYERARVFCQPSFGEPFGMTVIEAMASGRPVVGTAAGGIPDAVVDGKGGYLIPAGDAPLLADGLASAITNASRMGVFNRERAERRYALNLVAERIELTYHAVTKNGERAHVAS